MSAKQSVTLEVPAEWSSPASDASSKSSWASSPSSSSVSSASSTTSPRSASNRRKSAFGDSRAAFARQATLHDLSTGYKMKRKKVKRVNIIPEAVKMELAITQLAEIKRNKTVGETWNSAAIFSVMVVIYTVAAVAYLSFDSEATACPYWQVYFGMRCLVLLPSSVLAWLWGRGSWSRRMPLPETMGFVLFGYLALIITISFTTSINQSCGRQIIITDSTVYAKLVNKLTGVTFQLRRGECETFTEDDHAKSLGECEAKLVDRRTWFEVHVAEFVGQLLLTLFAYTALFKPSYKTSAVYTGVVLFLGFLGCWWQGFEFWQDPDRVIGSGVGPAIFVFVCAALVNVFNSNEMRKLEQSLVNASHELSEARYLQPTGEKVVYLKAEIVGAQELTLENPALMDRSVAMARDLFLSLSKTYFGYELTLDGELKQLLSTGKALTAEQTKLVQELMKSGKREDSDFLVSFHDVYDALSFALTFQNELMDLDWETELCTSKSGMASTEGVAITPEEKESRARAMTVGTFVRAKDSDVLNLTAFHGLRVKIGVHIGPDTDGLQGSTVRFTESLTSLAQGGMVLVSPPVAEQLAGALEQLSKTTTSKSKDKDDVPRLVHMGSLLFEGSEIYHEALLAAAQRESLAMSQSGGGGGGGGSTGDLRNSADDAVAAAAAKAARDVEASSTGDSDLSDVPVDTWHIYNEPLFGRHIKWDDLNLKLPNAEQLQFGYYDAPVKRENRPEFAVVCFGDVDNSHELMHEDHPTFTEAVGEVNQVMNRLLVKHKGYNVPQREGHYMQTFSDPKDAVAYHTELQHELLHSRNWPPAYKANPYTRPYHDTAGSGDLLYSGLQISLGMSVGKISKSLERARANYLGPTCNRSARVCGLAKGGQLLMCQSEYEQKELALVRALFQAKVMLRDQILKGIKGAHNIVYIETDALTTRRAAVPRPKPGDQLRGRRSETNGGGCGGGGSGAGVTPRGNAAGEAGGGEGGGIALKTMSGLTMKNFGMTSPRSANPADNVTSI